MFLNHLVRLIIIIPFFIFCPNYAMDCARDPHFYIKNEYGKNIHFCLTFEYQDERTSCADLEETITILPEQTLPINILNLKLQDFETKKIANLAELNLHNVTIEAWVLGWEIKKDLESEIIYSVNSAKDATENASNAWGNTLNNGRKLLEDGWKFLMQRWNAPQEECIAYPEDCEMQVRGQSIHDEGWQQPERCAAHIPLDHYKLIQITIDPIRSIPLIRALEDLSTDTHGP